MATGVIPGKQVADLLGGLGFIGFGVSGFRVYCLGSGLACLAFGFRLFAVEGESLRKSLLQVDGFAV